MPGRLAGLEELLGYLPGPPGPPCQAHFSETDFHSLEIWWEVWFRRSARDAFKEFVGAIADCHYQHLGNVSDLEAMCPTVMTAVGVEEQQSQEGCMAMKCAWAYAVAFA